MQIIEAHVLDSEVSWKWICMLVGSLCLIASSLNVGQKYLSSAPNNRFISRFLKTPKMCHMHEETNFSSCICIFLLLSFHFSFFIWGEEDFGHCVCLTYSCSLSFFIYCYYFYSYSSQYGRPTAKSILINWLVLTSRSTTELIQAAIKNKTLVITCKLPSPSIPDDLLVLCLLLIFLNSYIFTLPCLLSQYEPSSLAPSFTERIKWRKHDLHDLCFTNCLFRYNIFILIDTLNIALYYPTYAQIYNS